MAIGLRELLLLSISMVLSDFFMYDMNKMSSMIASKWCSPRWVSAQRGHIPALISYTHLHSITVLMI